jgi:hypothetical protein
LNNKQSTDSVVSLSIQVLNDNQISTDDLDEMTRLLRNEIEEHSATENVRLKPTVNEPVAGTKSAAQAFTLGAVVLAVLPDAVSALIGFVQEWTLRPGNQPVKIKVQVKDRSVEIEFDPRVNSKQEMIVFARELQVMVAEQSDD